VAEQWLAMLGTSGGLVLGRRDKTRRRDQLRIVNAIDRQKRIQGAMLLPVPDNSIAARHSVSGCDPPLLRVG
jgi:hypothetical protein